MDNGTHLMIGAYASTLDLVRRAGASDLVLSQENLKLEWVDDKGVTALECPPLRAPLHLLVGLFGLRVPLSVAAGGAPDLFTAVCVKGADTLIADATQGPIAQRLPAWLITNNKPMDP